MLIVSWHLEWLTCLRLFIMVGFEKLQPQFKNSTHFSCYESLSKGYNVLMTLLLTLILDAMSHNGQRQCGGLNSLYRHPLPGKKNLHTK